MNSISSYLKLPGCEFVELRFQVVLPMFIGFIYGPLAGFIVGFFGDRLGYAIHNQDILYAWNWSIGNGFIGMIPGFRKHFKIEVIKSVGDYGLLIVLASAASFLPIVFASVLDAIFLKISFTNSLYTLILPASITDAVFGLLLLPLMLIAVKKLFFTIATRNMLLISYLLILSVILTYFVSVYTMWNNSGAKNFMVQDLYNIGILSFSVLAVGFAVSIIAVKKVTSPIITIADTASEIAAGNYAVSKEFENIAERDDEIGKLASVFKTMIAQVYKREETLKKELKELQVILEKQSNIQTVEKITKSEYFQRLKGKVKELRTRDEKR
ncbi:MAG TPA: ECF transporter S component [bacterium]|nr:ECF transporter S component [bacterium]